jgi:antitoxin component of MazEF toxin-antitoxin module
MKERFIKAVRKNGDSLAITIPSEVAEFLKIKENDFLRIEIEKISKHK